MQTSQPMSNIQLELLKLYATDIPDEDLINIKRLMVQYFAEKITQQMDMLWEENNWTAQTMHEWAASHIRSSKEENKQKIESFLDFIHQNPLRVPQLIIPNREQRNER